MKKIFKYFLFSVFMLVTFSCNTQNKKIIRVGHNQSINHPTHKGMIAFKEFIEEKLNGKYSVELFPSELLGSQNDMTQLTQTGAIDFVVASNAIMEKFAQDYSIFNLPYLFENEKAYHMVMDDENITTPIYKSTQNSGFEVVTWLDAGSRSFYTIKKPILKPEDLRGLKIRVQQSPTNIEMMKLLGGSATPMGFGEVYTALQSGILDGAENNEMALTDNGHGDVAKYYSYDMHQMVPDLVLANSSFLNSLSEDELKIFQEGFKILSKVQRDEWKKSVKNAIEKAKSDKHVEFFYPEVAAFKEAVLPLHNKLLNEKPKLKKIYDQIQEKNRLAAVENEKN